jgi:N-acetyltransferase
MPSPRHSKTTKPLTQVYLDCGQKQFGQLLCDRCGMLYMPGVAEDERHHRPLCQAYERGVPCVQGTVVGGKVVERSTGRRPFSIVRWKPSNNNKNHRPTQWPLLAQMIVKDLGMDEQTALEHLTTHTVFLYLGSVCGGSSSSSSNKSNPHHILGVVTIRPISQAYRMSSLHERSLTPSQAMLGIGILWTHPAARKTGVAATLVNCARRHAVFGMVVEKSMIAFSSPTQAGYDFAMRYLNDSDMKEVKQMAPLVYEM